jgi:LPS-assembly protein
MMMVFFIFLLSLNLFFIGESHGGEVVNKEGISIWADLLTYDYDNNLFHAKGNVMIISNEIIIIADTATFNEKTDDATAEGSVRLVKGGDVLYCDQMKINLDSEKGEVTNGNIFSRQSNFRIQGDKIEKVGKDEYHLDHGTFTTCNGDSPSWKFTADDIDATMGGLASSRNTLFYVKGIPLLYTPYMLFPVKIDRQTGFLLPHVGNSKKKGFNLVIPYYWAISPSQEAEIQLDIQTKRGAGLDVQYNWLRPMESIGKSHVYYIYDTKMDRGRGSLDLQEQEWYSKSFSLKSDISLVTDKGFFKDYSVVSGEYNRQILDSSISLTKNWESVSLAGETRFVQDLEADNNNTMQKLPTVKFTSLSRRIGDLPVYLGFDSTFVNFYHDAGIRGQRIDFHPTLALYLPMADGIDFSAWGGYRERLYNAYSPGVVQGTNTNEPGDGTSEVGLAEGGAKITASFTNVYETDLGTLKKLRHVIVPEINYSWVEENSQGEQPAFNFDDRVPGQMMTSWALTNYLTGKYQSDGDTPEYRDIAYLKLSQGYQFRGTRRDLLTLVDDGKHFTDMRIEADISPLKGLTLVTDSRFNTYSTRFSTIAAGMDITDGKDNVFGLSYRYSREREFGPFSARSILDPTSDTTTGDQVNYLESKVKLSLINPFVFNYKGRYSFDRGGFLETSYSLEYKHQCWSVEFIYHDRQATGDRGFMVTFTLAGIGPIGKYKMF